MCMCIYLALRRTNSRTVGQSQHSQEVSMTEEEKDNSPLTHCRLDLRRPMHLPHVRMPSDLPALYSLLHGSSWLHCAFWIFSTSNHEGMPLPPGCIRSKCRSYGLKQQLQLTLLQSAGPTLGGGCSPLRTQAGREQSSGLAQLQSRLFPRVPE